MNTPDELEHLWKTQPVDPAVKGEEMRNIILNRMAKFDRTIRRRNIRETVAAAAVAAFFTYIAWRQHDGFVLAGSIILVASALWIIYYLWRYGTEAPDPNPDQTVAGYEQALVRKYDHQIGLLRTVKFWYLAPMYVGLLTLSAATLRELAKEGSLTWLAFLFPFVYTVVFGAIWWLNEVYAVGRLRRMRERVLSGIGDREGQC